MAQNPPPKSGNQAKEKDAPRARSFMRDDFPFIRKASLTLLACIVLGAGLVVGSEYFLERQQTIKATAKPLDDQAREKYMQAENERREIHDFQRKYMQLFKKGFIGDEKRLDWIEGIKHIQEQRALLSIHYEISAQQAFQEDPTMETGALELRGSKMQVKMNLLHEMDLLNFLGDLKSIQAYSLQDCNIKRVKLNVQEKLSPRLYAECSLYWITLGKRAGAEGEDPQAVPATSASAQK